MTVLQAQDVDLIRDGRPILTGVTLTVEAGQHWALLGPNGAGKSTLLSLLGARAHPTRGTVRVLGRQLGRVDLRELHRHIGHVNPRHPLRSPLTVRQVVLTGSTGSIEPPPRWTPTRQLQAEADRLIGVLGLEHRGAARWTTLSQGERGRALIARALLPRPRVLLLDEPATGLDLAGREQLIDHLNLLPRTFPRLATVLVTHHLEELPTTITHAALLRDGHVLAAGEASRLLTSDQVSACFDHPVALDRTAGRWAVRAHTPS
ncbi:ABC transporter ATP-binding protein [Streptomyces sp. NPDC048595]|uniref:ABC transporter ATP-binding protein n=1 Tax=Streptomyces sp. NPDC048595 TaxID=3365576 RepID=UPI0037143F51